MGKIGSVFLFLLLMSQTAYADFDVQEAIDTAKVGEIVFIPAGRYQGNFVVTKSVTLLGEIGTELVALGNEPALRIDGASSVVIEHMAFSANEKAIVAKDIDGLTLSHLTINNAHTGVHIQNAKNVHVQHLDVTGTDAHYSKKGNGIAIFKGKDIVVEDTNIAHVQDGIYVEDVERIAVQKNTVTNSRYGTHFMYTKNVMVSRNTYQTNVTGLMVMMTNDIRVEHNTLTAHNDLNGYGMLLFDVRNASLDNNTITNNRTGLALQKSISTHISNNDFQMNQTALEGTKIDDESFATNNKFTGNILTARSDQQGIQLMNNYYDDYSGLDIDGDGIGDTPYVAVSSFGQWMVRQPVYQYFVEAPSVVLLTSLDRQINKTEKKVLVDTTPRLISVEIPENTNLNSVQLLLGLLFVLGGVWVWKRGIME